MGKINSRAKGKRGELYVANKFKDRGYGKAHRTAQFKGNTGQAGDIEGVDFIHVEVKFKESLNLNEAMEQAINDSSLSDRKGFPTVFHKKNNKPLMVTMLFDDWINLYDSYYSDMRIKKDKKEI